MDNLELIQVYQLAGRCLLQLRRRVSGEWSLIAGKEDHDLCFYWVRRDTDRRLSFTYQVPCEHLLTSHDPLDNLLQSILHCMGDVPLGEAPTE